MFRKRKEKKLIEQQRRRELQKRQEYNATIRILVAGSRNSGKTVIIKNIIVESQNDEERKAFRANIMLYLIRNTIIVLNRVEYGDNSELSEAKEFILSVADTESNVTLLSPRLKSSLRLLWKDKMFLQKRSIDTHDNFTTLCDKLLLDKEFCSEDWIPDATAINLHYTPTNDMVQHDTTINSMKFTLYDTDGSLKGRKRLIMFTDLTAVIFVVSLSSFDETMAEGTNRNCLKDSITFFQSLVNSPIVDKQAIIIAYTKQDKLKEKLDARLSLNSSGLFPDAPEHPSVDEAIEYINFKFMEGIDATKEVKPVYVHTLDADVTRAVFNIICESILRQNLRANGFVGTETKMQVTVLNAVQPNGVCGSALKFKKIDPKLSVDAVNDLISDPMFGSPYGDTADEVSSLLDDELEREFEDLAVEDVAEDSGDEDMDTSTDTGRLNHAVPPSSVPCKEKSQVPRTKRTSMQVEHEAQTLAENEAQNVDESEATDTRAKVAEKLKNTETTPSPNLVYFSAFAPQRVKTRDEFVLNVWAFIKENMTAIIKKERAKGNDEVGSKGPLRIAYDSLIEFQLTLPKGFKCENPYSSVEWLNESTNASFAVICKKRTRPGLHTGRVDITINGSKRGVLHFLLKVVKSTSKSVLSFNGMFSQNKQASGGVEGNQEPQPVVDLNSKFVILPKKHSPHVFLSYRRTFVDLADRIKRVLNDYGYECFLDINPDSGIEAGPFQAQLEEKLKSAPIVIPLITNSPSGKDELRKDLTSLDCIKKAAKTGEIDWCYEELKVALHDKGKIVIPLFRDVDLFKELADLPKDIQGLRELNCRQIHDDLFDQSIQVVHQFIQKKLQQIELSE